MRCIICDSSDWESVDNYREKPEGMHICKSCGFVSYPEKYGDIEEIKAHYRKDYRPGPTVGNLYTGERKLQNHNAFLRPLIERWAKENRKPEIFEVGAAYGLFLNWARHEFKNATVSGSEWTTSYKRVSEHEFGIELVDDFDSSKEWDLIASYKVLEHQLDADKELETYRKCLKKGGYLYLSVPIWFERLTNFGAEGFNIEYYYHPDHINVWSETHFLALLKKTGFKIVEENASMYDFTYLLEATEPEKIEINEYKTIREALDSIKKASDFYKKNKFEEALACWANFPSAHRGFYEHNRKQIHDTYTFEEMQDQFFPKILKSCPRDHSVRGLIADVCMRYDKFAEAIKWLKEALEMKPQDPTYLMMLAHCFRGMGEQTESTKEKVRLTMEARNISKHVAMISSQMRPEAINWAYFDSANIPSQRELQGLQS